MDKQKELYEKLASFKEEVLEQKRALEISAIVASTDKKGRITYANENFCKISGYSEEELLGKDHRIINSGFHSESFFKEMWKTISSGQVWRGEIKNRSKSGEEYWVYTTIIPFMDELNHPYKYVAIRYDITEKKRMEKQMEEERERLRHSEKMATLGVMSAGIAHEIGNPLGAIRGRMEMLEMFHQNGKLDEEKVLQTSSEVIKLVDRIHRIVKALSSYAREGSNDPIQKISLTQLVLDIFELSQEKLRKKKISLRSNGLDKEVACFCRETDVAQVLINLINNSMDAIENTEDPWIEIDLIFGEKDLEGHILESQALEKPTHILLKVKDSGQGLSEEMQKKIFDPFFTTKPPGKGTGLGLSISSSLLVSQNGRLYYNKGGVHTEFVIELPVVVAGAENPLRK